MARKIKCAACGEIFISDSWKASLCSDECRRAKQIEQNRERRQRLKAERANRPKVEPIYDGRTKQTVKHKSTMAQLTADAIEAHKRGMTYGKYIALAKGRTRRGV